MMALKQYAEEWLAGRRSNWVLRAHNMGSCPLRRIIGASGTDKNALLAS